MAVFDDFDRRVAAAVGRTFEDEVIWRPMQAREGSAYVPGQGIRPDLTRPSRALPAIITWAITGMQVEGTPRGGGGEVGLATLFVDFEWILFEEDFARFGLPKRGDRIELPFEKHAEDRLAEITRVGDDGSSRFYAWCSLVRQ